MKCEVKDQQRLLELQAVDVELSQLRRRRATLPIEAQVRKMEDQAALLHNDLIAAQTQAQDLIRMVAKSEEELARVRARAARDREMADQGVAARIQTELQHELTSLARRLSDLEDAELEMMEQQDRVATSAEQLQDAEAQMLVELRRSRSQRDEELRSATNTEADLTARRRDIAALIPDGLLATYEEVRAGGGVGAAVIVGRQCQGCRLELPASDVSRILTAPPEEIEFCEECGCILVRA